MPAAPPPRRNPSYKCLLNSVPQRAVEVVAAAQVAAAQVAAAQVAAAQVAAVEEAAAQVAAVEEAAVEEALAVEASVDRKRSVPPLQLPRRPCHRTPRQPSHLSLFATLWRLILARLWGSWAGLRVYWALPRLPRRPVFVPFTLIFPSTASRSLSPRS